MKNTLLSFVFAVAMICGFQVRADEGMWLPMFVDRLNYVDMQKMGLRLTAEEIYSINHSSLKDAIIQFGRGCTGEIVSDQGLVFTNHHCGYGRIQAHSTIEHDYLTNGFWAMNLNEELPNDGLTATFLVRMEDVTQKVLAEIKPGMTEEERAKKVKEISGKIETEAKGNVSYYNAVVRSFYQGNEFYLFLYEVYNDVRLVGAPPSSIGKFGGDTDNWMWPRHTGDFSIFRVYTGPDGKPAAYSPQNIPLKPKHYLPVSVKGVNKNDYAMVMGYPGRTDRYLTSYGVKLAIEVSNPTTVAIRDRRLSIMRNDMDASDAVRIKYASKYAGIANYWKYFIGQTKGLKRLKVYEKKKEQEAAFAAWVNAKADRKATYGTALSDIAAAYEEIGKVTKLRVYYIEALLNGSEVMGFARGFENLVKLMKSDQPDQAKIDETIKELKTKSAAFFKDYNAATDQRLLAAVFEMFAKNIPTADYPAEFANVNNKYKGDFTRFASDVFAKSIFTDSARVGSFLRNPKVKQIEKDPAYKCAVSFLSGFQQLMEKLNATQSQLGRGNRLYIAGLREMNPDKKYYPDANSTMRLTYGKVLDYYPADAVHYDFVTTLEGVMEKEDPSVDEFVVPKKLKELYQAKDYGPYGTNGELVTCFTTTNDITGGNSGSPVLNANGELIGLAFDGNWEAMSGDIAFETELQRTICVDVRYVLFIIDKFAGAKNLIAELKLR
ncbi:MAG: S46 family peptidase [Bacteroidales bacterium]